MRRKQCYLFSYLEFKLKPESERVHEGLRLSLSVNCLFLLGTEIQHLQVWAEALDLYSLIPARIRSKITIYAQRNFVGTTRNIAAIHTTDEQYVKLTDQEGSFLVKNTNSFGGNSNLHWIRRVLG